MNIKILGSGQDAGIPHIGCYCRVCCKARQHPVYKRLGPSLAVFNRTDCYLIDISPDFKNQLPMIPNKLNRHDKQKFPIKGIFLTHAHLGHCAGLWFLGKEALDTKNVPVFCTPSMKRFLSTNYPFSLLVQRKNIRIKELHHGKPLQLNGFKCVPIQVPHRNEIADTVGYIISNNRKRLIYLPDVDCWTAPIIKEIKLSDIALIDGTFYSAKELPRFKEVPHPPVEETIKQLKNIDTQIYLTHINHTNPLNLRGKERRYIDDSGFKIAYDGMIL